jgi:hypothetical protein
MKLAFALAAAALLSAPARIPPQDECRKDASFVAYRSSLKAAVKARDARLLLSLVAQDIAFSFGDGAGKAEFAREWRLDQPAQSALWAELEEVLSLGCALQDGSAEAPWLYARFPQVLDPFDHAVVVRPGAAAHAAPNRGSKVLARLNWDILPVLSDLGDAWAQVRLTDGRKAYVRRQDLRSPIDYRAGFERRGGRWLMVMFIAGD